MAFNLTFNSSETRSHGDGSGSGPSDFFTCPGMVAVQSYACKKDKIWNWEKCKVISKFFKTKKKLCVLFTKYSLIFFRVCSWSILKWMQTTEKTLTSQNEYKITMRQGFRIPKIC